MRNGWVSGGVLALLVVVSPARGADTSDLGARLYAERCSPCHGDEGRGDGPTAPALVPPPRNFRDPALWKDRTTEQLRATVQGGKPGTMMPPFRDVLSDAEIDAVVAYLRRFDPRAPDDANAGNK
jgi:mono/diheme cytochrome c family protein